MGRIERIVEFLEARYGERIRERSPRWSGPFNVLIGCLLSQRTKEENTERAVSNLFSVADTPERILKIPKGKLERLIKPSGTFRQKARRIKEICKILLERHGGKVPRTREQLLRLPGVGFKTAAITLMYGHGIPTIGVDTHVERVSKRLGLVEEGVDIEGVRLRLESLIPKNKWYLVNLGFVRFGREICRPRGPQCHVCPIEKLCSYKTKNL